MCSHFTMVFYVLRSTLLIYVAISVSGDSFNDYHTARDLPTVNIQSNIHDGRMRQLTAMPDSIGRAISFTKYNRYEEIVAYLDELARDFPDVVTVGSIGTSYEGRDIPIIKISSGGNGNRPVVLVDAGIHAREWIAPAMALYIIQQLVENPSNADLLANADWHIIPTLNPDGYEYSHTTNRLWRKTRSSTSCLTAGSGVDANRNFGFFWTAPGAGNNPCSESFMGDFPFSEAETAALRDYVLRNASLTKMYITFHSPGKHILYPWGFSGTEINNWKELDDLARAANDAQIAAGGENYTISSLQNGLYTVSGCSIDWMKSVADVELPYHIELPGGTYGFDLPASHILDTVSIFFTAIRVFGEYANKF